MVPVIERAQYILPWSIVPRQKPHIVNAEVV